MQKLQQNSQNWPIQARILHSLCLCTPAWKKGHNRRMWRLWLKYQLSTFLQICATLSPCSVQVSGIRLMPRTVACSRKAGSSEANTFSACLSSAHDCPPLCPSQWPVWQMYSDYSPTHSPTVPWPLNRRWQQLVPPHFISKLWTDGIVFFIALSRPSIQHGHSFLDVHRSWIVWI